MKILIAEDDPVSRTRLAHALVGLGHEVVAVADGRAASEELLRPEGPRLAILDWMMPGADGLEVCRAVRARAAHYVYVILLSSRHGQEDVVTGLNAEADDFLSKPFDVSELAARLRSGERVLELQEDLLRAQDELRSQATHDHLTGLWNRAMILDQLVRELNRAERTKSRLAVALADLDDFKGINDTYGHAVGDDVLRHAGQRISSQLRKCDYVGRYGGEEFLLVLPGCDLNGAAEVAERVRLNLAAEPLRSGGVLLPVRVSLGIAASWPTVNPPLLIKAADDALYRAKARGRNRVES
jgi:two-component system cell cycle response regulator